MDELALRNQLSNLETLRLSLHWWIHFWEWVVVIGIALEFVVLVMEYCEELYEFRLAMIRLPEKPKIWPYVVAFLGVLMVALGITKQLGIDSRIEHIETQIRAIDEQLFGMVSKEAEGAITAADKAQQKSDAADSVAEQAKGKAEVVSSRTNELTQELTKDEQSMAVLETKRAELEASLKNLAVRTAPRVLPPWTWVVKPGEIKKDSDALKPFAEYKADIEFLPDPEARRAALNIAEALKRAGWSESNVTLAIREGIPDGVGVRPFLPKADASLWTAQLHSREAAEALVGFLHSYNWQAKVTLLDDKGQVMHDPKTFPPDTIRIWVGLYPPVMFVIPSAMKGLADAVAEKQQEINQKVQEWRRKYEEDLFKHATPKQIMEYKERREKWEKLEKQQRERTSGPCQILIPSFFSP
jgi:hypothetical protein